jgi:hypothetical protein
MAVFDLSPGCCRHCGCKKFRISVYEDRWFPWCNRCGQDWTPPDRKQGQDADGKETVAEPEHVAQHVVSPAKGK